MRRSSRNSPGCGATSKKVCLCAVCVRVCIRVCFACAFVLCVRLPCCVSVLAGDCHEKIPLEALWRRQKCNSCTRHMMTSSPSSLSHTHARYLEPGACGGGQRGDCELEERARHAQRTQHNASKSAQEYAGECPVFSACFLSSPPPPSLSWPVSVCMDLAVTYSRHEALQDTQAEQADPAEVGALREQVESLERQLSHAVQVHTFFWCCSFLLECGWL